MREVEGLVGQRNCVVWPPGACALTCVPITARRPALSAPVPCVPPQESYNDFSNKTRIYFTEIYNRFNPRWIIKMDDGVCARRVMDGS